MTSTPDPPVASLPQEDSEMRFYQTDYPSEWAESYRPGGFHPVNLGDTFKFERYRVIRKLGYGSFSTVWLAKDTLYSRYVALKVMDARSSSQNDIELSILNKIKNAGLKDPAAKYVLTYMDEFRHVGPNGVHTCLVSEPMGPTVASLVEKLPQYKDRTSDTKLRYPKSMAKLILKHTLLGLVFLHTNGIVHADLQPGNLLVSISDISALPEEDLQQDQSGRDQESTPELLQRCDGGKDRWAPRYLFLGQSILEYTQLDQEMVVKISDLGAAFWTSDPPKSTATPLALRAPELIFGDKIDSTIDIWSFGCLLYELLTGNSLFCVAKFGSDEQESADDDHLLQMNDILEPFSDVWLTEKWPRADRYFGDCSGNTGGANRRRNDGRWIDPPLEVRFEENKPDDIDNAEAAMITSLLRSILRYEPSQRPSAAEILKHRWFEG